MDNKLVKALDDRDKLRNVLAQYREYTVTLIQDLEKGNSDNLQELIEKRQQALDSLANGNYVKDEIAELFKELSLQQLHDKVIKLMESELDVIRNKVRNLSKSKTANNVYNKNVYGGANVFSKKI